MEPTVIDECLTDDDMLHVFEFLQAPELLEVSLVCTRWYELVQTEALWKNLCLVDKKLSFKPEDMTWKRVYGLKIDDMCPHLSGIENKALLWLGEKLKGVCDDPKTKCSGNEEEEECSFTLEYLWFCMSEGCGYKGCGRRDKGHALQHFQSTDHPLYIKLNTLEMWCHDCCKWIGDQDRNPIEIAQVNRIRRCVNSIAKPQSIDINSGEMERRQYERCLPGLKESDNIRYLVSADWLAKWVRFVIGDTGPPTDPIDNDQFLTASGALRERIPPFGFVGEAQWNYFKEHYVGATTSICLVYNEELQSTVFVVSRQSTTNKISKKISLRKSMEEANKHQKLEISISAVESGVNIYKTNINPITYTSSPPEVSVEPVPNLDCAWYLHNVLTPEECDQVIDVTEKMGYELARITTMGGMVEATHIRNNKRMMWQTEEEIWKPIWERIKDKVPQSASLWSSKWEAYGLNERLRFYRYKAGEVFNKHYDGCFPRNNRDMSLLTFIIYLNDDFEGGQTTFFLRGRNISVQPKRGSALIFWHGEHPASPLHEGSRCISGTKYVLRSDVMYKR